MPIPTSGEIQQSLSKLQSGSPLLQKDHFNIAWQFTFLPNREKLLHAVYSENEKLGETLLLFKNRLIEAANNSRLEEMIKRAFLHYVVNTEGAIATGEEEDFFEVFQAATDYAETLRVKVEKGENEDSILTFNSKKEICPKWGSQKGLSSAKSLREVGPLINEFRYGRKDVIPPDLFDFDENAAEYSLQNALILSDFSNTVYFEPDYIPEVLENLGYNDFQWIEDKKTDTQAFVTGKDNHTILCFRGTSSKKDILIDSKFFIKTAAFRGHGRVHRGFQQSLISVWKQVESAVKSLGSDRKLFICGHSLGAGVGVLAAHRFQVKERPVAGVYLYGTPRVGNRSFRNFYNEILEKKTFLHVNNADIVTRIPPTIFGYRHVGGPRRIFDAGHLVAFSEEVSDDNGNDKQFRHLDEESKRLLEENLFAAESAIKASTHFLTMSSNDFRGIGYGTTHEKGSFDEHGISQYLFKFCCSHLEQELERLKQLGL